jgi:hypothetical protein
VWIALKLAVRHREVTIDNCVVIRACERGHVLTPIDLPIDPHAARADRPIVALYMPSFDAPGHEPGPRREPHERRKRWDPIDVDGDVAAREGQA